MILLINTCGTDAVVALADGARVIAERSLPGRSASEQILLNLRELLSEAPTLDAVGVVHGPGSFTGVRVGLSVAKGLCEARGIGMITMSRLALICAESQAGPTLALLDAGRGEFYCGLTQGKGMLHEEIRKLGAVLPLLHSNAVLTCEPRVVETLSAYTQVTLVAEPGAQSLLAMLQRRITAGEWSDVAAIDANYLRRTDAELLQEAK